MKQTNRRVPWEIVANGAEQQQKIARDRPAPQRTRQRRAPAQSSLLETLFDRGGIGLQAPRHDRDLPRIDAVAHGSQGLAYGGADLRRRSLCVTAAQSRRGLDSLARQLVMELREAPSASDVEFDAGLIRSLQVGLEECASMLLCIGGGREPVWIGRSSVNPSNERNSRSRSR